MADILGSVKQYFVTKETSLDNGVFKLFSKGSVAVCLLGSLLCAASQVYMLVFAGVEIKRIILA